IVRRRPPLLPLVALSQVSPAQKKDRTRGGAPVVRSGAAYLGSSRRPSALLGLVVVDEPHLGGLVPRVQDVDVLAVVDVAGVGCAADPLGPLPAAVDIDADEDRLVVVVELDLRPGVLPLRPLLVTLDGERPDLGSALGVVVV